MGVLLSAEWAGPRGFSPQYLCPFSNSFPFLMWIIFKDLIDVVTVFFLFYALVFWLPGMWNLRFPTRDKTYTACAGRWSLNHWTAREGP